MEQRWNVGGNSEEACTTLGGLIGVGCSFSDRRVSRSVRWMVREITQQCEADHEISRGVRWMDCMITQQCEADREISCSVRQTARYHAV